MMLLAFTFICSLGTTGQSHRTFTLSSIEWLIESELPTLVQLEASDWEDRGPREKLFPGDDQGLIFNLSQLDLGARGAWVLRLNHSRLGFRLQGLSRATGRWEPIESRAELPLGMVLTRDQLTPFSHLSIQNTGTSIGILNLHRMSQVDVIRSVKSQGTLQLIVFGVFAFIVVCPILLWVFFKRSVYGWYCLYLFGGWLVVWVAAPGNSTVPFWAKDWFPINALGLSCSLSDFSVILRSAFLGQPHQSLRSGPRGCLRGLIVGLLPGLMFIAPVAGDPLWSDVAVFEFRLGPYLLFNKRSSDLGARFGFWIGGQ